MTNIVTTLLDFILDLLRDPAKAADFNNDPHAALASAGLTGVTADDVNAVLPMVADCSPVRDWQASYAPAHSGGSPWHGDSAGHHDSVVEAAHRPPHRPDHDEDHDRGDHDRGDHDRGHHGGDHDGPEHQGQEFAVIQHLQYIQNSYSYSETNVHLEDSIWAQDGSAVFFGDDNVLNTGGGVVLSNVDSRGDIDVDNEQTTVTDSYNHAEDGGVIGDGNEVDNSTTDNSTHDSHDVDFDNNGNVAYAGDDQAIGNTVTDDSYHSTSISDSGNVGSIVDSKDAHLGDTTIDDHTSYDNDDYTYNDDSYNTDNSINDSYKADNSINDSYKADNSIDDSYNTDASSVDSGNTDNSTDDSYNGNDVLSDNDDSAVAVDGSAAATDPDLVDVH